MDAVVLLRHGEAEKNLSRLHGGPGTGITKGGQLEIQALCKRMPAMWGTPQTVVCMNKPQCVESANIISAHFSIACQIVEIAPFNLGVLDGLSEDEASRQHPRAANRMQDWREGRIEVSELRLPGSTNPTEFFARMKGLSVDLQRRNGVVVFLATRSVLVGMASYFLGRHPRPGGGYREIPWSNCGWALFREETAERFVLGGSRGVAF